jgi:hypothetical protein
MQETNSPPAPIVGELKCRQCGAVLQYRPGTSNLHCPYCGVENAIEATPEKIEERDYERFLAEAAEKEEKLETAVVTCPGCGASVSLRPNLTSDSCPYCATSLVVSGGSTSCQLKPQALLPFGIDAGKAQSLFGDWARRRWFAPESFRKGSRSPDRFRGLYIPYWTFDADTLSRYAGERGDHYYTTETYPARENGRTVMRTRRVQHTRWSPVSGSLDQLFDDQLVLASRSLPARYAARLTPWDLKRLIPFNGKYLSGFQTESYQVELREGFDAARAEMESAIRGAVRARIGGDEQRIHSLETSWRRVTFKHVLLPVWISSFRFNGKLYRFLINGCSGEVQGERPWSVAKIALAVLGALGLIALLVLLLGN